MSSLHATVYAHGLPFTGDKWLRERLEMDAPKLARQHASFAVLPQPDVHEKAKRLGMEMRPSTPDEMTERMKADIVKWGAVIARAGIEKRE